jgi:hypothetical protein
MAETLVTFKTAVVSPDRIAYQARACGAQSPDGGWAGWIEFTPADGGKAIRTGRETTQPNRTDTEYWATGLTPVYLEGALKRALEGPASIVSPAAVPPAFEGPAPAVTYSTARNRESVLDPFSVYAKGPPLLRNRLRALSAWHLVNIVLAYELSDEPGESLNRRSSADLVELIVDAVRERQELLDR